MQAGTYFPIECSFMFLLQFEDNCGQPPRCFAGTLLLTLSPPETDPQILEDWGYADEVHLGKSFRARDFGLECSHDEQRLSESNPSDWLHYVRDLPQNRCRLRRVHILRYATQLSCTFQHSHCTFVTILFKPLLGCSSMWRCG